MFKTALLKTKLGWLKIFMVTIVCALLFVGWTILVFSNNSSKYPEDLVIDDQGNLFISESSKGEVLKFNAKGDQLASFGSNGKNDDQFKRIWGPARISVDQRGQVYASQDDETSLHRFDPRGNFLGKLEIGQEPKKLLSDSQNNLYVLVRQAPFILKFDSNGHPLKSWNEQGSQQTQFHSVNSLAIDRQDNLYVVDDGVLKKFDPQGTLANSWSLKNSSYSSMAVDGQGRIYFLSGSYQIYELDNQGQVLANWGVQGQGKEQFRSDIRQIALDQQDNLYVLSVEDGPFVVKKFDHTGKLISQWSYGWPRWISSFLNVSGWIVGIIISLIFRLGMHWSKSKAVRQVKGEPLPDWVVAGQTNPHLLHDHLDLGQLARARKKLQSIDERPKPGFAFGAAFIFLVIVFISAGVVFSLDGFSLNPFTIGLGVISLIAVGVIWLEGRKLYQHAKKLEQKHLALASQVLGTMPVSNQASIIGSEKAFGLGTHEVTNLSFNLIFYLPLALISAGTVSYGSQSNWFEGWPGWLIQIVIVNGLVGMVLGCLWLFNRLQKERPGKIKLNRAEMGSLQGPAWLWLAIFAAMTIALDSLNDWLSSFNRQPDLYYSYSSPSFLSIIAFILKYAYLLIGFFYVLDRWLHLGLNKGDYSRSLRCLTYLRSICDILSLRLLQAEVLRMAGRLPEAEYLLQETLSKPLYQEDAPYLARILAALAMLRLSQERYAESMFLLEQSLQLKPDSKVNYSNLAQVYLWLQHWPERAFALLEQSGESTFWLRESYSVADRTINRAWAMAQRGQTSEANRLMKQVLTRAIPRYRPGRASLYIRAAQIKRLLGADLEALNYYQQAAKLDPIGISGKMASTLEGEIWQFPIQASSTGD